MTEKGAISIQKCNHHHLPGVNSQDKHIEKVKNSCIRKFQIHITSHSFIIKRFRNGNNIKDLLALSLTANDLGYA